MILREAEQLLIDLLTKGSAQDRTLSGVTRLYALFQWFPASVATPLLLMIRSGGRHHARFALFAGRHARRLEEVLARKDNTLDSRGLGQRGLHVVEHDLPPPDVGNVRRSLPTGPTTSFDPDLLDHRGIGNRMTSPLHRGTSSPLASARAQQPTRRVAQAQQSPQPHADSRTIYVVDNDVLRGLPATVRSTAVAELKRIYDFVGAASGQRAMTIRTLSPDRFPEAFAMTDAVVTLLAEATGLQSRLNQAIALQRRNATESFRRRGVNARFQDQRVSRPPETVGIAASLKQTVQAGNQTFALSLMYSAVAVDAVKELLVEDFHVRGDEQRVRKRMSSPQFDPRYWGSSQALHDVRALSVFDNPTSPNQWLTELTTLGAALGRAMAHEVRHLYTLVYSSRDHADTGLGASEPNLVNDPAYARFSDEDERHIIDVLQRLGNEQGAAIVIDTYPTYRRDAGFPF